MNIIHKDCDKSLAKNTSLPINSYLVTYLVKDEEKYDIVQASGRVEVFDDYYDEYGKESLKEIKWKQLVKLLKKLIKQEHLYSNKQLKEMKSQLRIVENELVELEKLTSKGFGK